MPDPIDQTTTNPQSLVDAALGTEPVTTSLPPLPPLQPLPEPTPASVPVGDDTPLAFVMPAPSSTPEVASIPTAEPVSSYLPPTPPVPPAPTMAPEQPKKKSKVGIVMAGIAAMIVVVGLVGYAALTGKPALIAGVLDDYAYNTRKEMSEVGTGSVGKNKEKDEKVARDGAALVAQQAAKKKAAEAAAKATDLNDAERKVLEQSLVQSFLRDPEIQAMYDNSLKSSNAQIAAGTAYHDFLKSKGLTIDDCYEQSVQGQARVLKTDNINSDICTKAQVSAKDAYAAAVCGNGYKMGVDAAGKPGCIPNTDVSCGRNLDPTAPVCCTTDYCESSSDGEYGLVCENPNARKECKSIGPDGTPVWCLLETNSSWCKGSGGGEDTTTTTTKTVAPTMSCNILTSTPDVKTTNPAIGNTITFTCAGSVVPASAGTLSYKFRYSINSGTVTTLTNKTATTAELTIAACGSYSVECQACATLNGTLTCDPIWTGATAQ